MSRPSAERPTTEAPAERAAHEVMKPSLRESPVAYLESAAHMRTSLFYRAWKEFGGDPSRAGQSEG